jgi:hypothetical protein
MRKAFLLILIFIGFFGVNVKAQVTLSPTAIFFENNFASLVVINNSTIPQDILLEFVFGYPASDTLGNVSMSYAKPENMAIFDISEYVRAFPRALTLQPGQRQTVRLNIRPTATLPDQVYWTRLKVISTPQTTEIAPNTDQAVQTQLNFIFEQILGLYFRKGSVNAVARLSNMDVLMTNNRRLIRYNVDMTGNAPFLGTISLQVTDANNRVVHNDSQLTSVFVNGIRNFELPATLPAGRYNVTVSMDPRRPDIPSAQLFPMQVATFSQTVDIP